MNEELQTIEAANEVATVSGLTRNQKVGIVVGSVVLTAGIGYGVYRLVKFLKAKKAAKSAEAETSSEEVHE